MSEPDEKEPKEPQEPTEVTPGGLEVRTPTRGEFFKNLEKASASDEDEG